MATPIKNTPTLEGVDAKNFMDELITIIAELESGKNKDKKKSELKRMKNSYKVVQSISNGAF